MRQNRENVSPMSNEGRNLYVVAHITDALLALMRQRPLGDISIGALCEAAGVGRASFYRNFTGKEDVLARELKRRLDAWWLDAMTKPVSTSRGRCLIIFTPSARHTCCSTGRACRT